MTIRGEAQEMVREIHTQSKPQLPDIPRNPDFDSDRSGDRAWKSRHSRKMIKEIPTQIGLNSLTSQVTLKALVAEPMSYGSV